MKNPRNVALRLVVSALALSSSAALAATLVVDGSLPRDLATGAVSLTLSVDGVTAAEIARGAADPTDPDAQLAARVVLKLAAPSEDNPPFTMFETRDHKDEAAIDGTHVLKYYVKWKEKRHGDLERLVASGPFKFDAAFYLGGATPDKLVAAAAGVTMIQPEVLAGVPDTPGTISAQGAVQVLWTPKVGDAPGLNIYAIEYEAGATLDLPAKRVSGVVGRPDQDTKCTWDAGTGTGGCISCSERSETYLDPVAIAKLPGVLVTPAATLDGMMTIGGLTPGQRYLIFMQYAPNGIKASQCMTGYPF